MSIVIPERATLKMAKASVTTDATGAGVILLKIPGTPGSGDGRLVHGGAGWFAAPLEGDYIKIYVTDEDNLLGQGAGYVVDSFIDDAVSAANQGIFISSHDPLMTISAIADDAFVPSGFYLKLVVQKASAVIDTFRCNIKWGKR